MGRILLRASLRRRKRRRSLPCTRFCSCCYDDNTNIRKSSTSSLHKKQDAAKKQGSGRVLKTTKKSSTVQVKLSNGQKPVRFMRRYPGRTNSINSQLKKVIVNVTRLSEDVLSVLSEFGSICACEVDSGSASFNSNPACKFVKSPRLTTPVRRLRSTPIVPVDRHTPSSVMDKLRVLNADWRSSTYPMSDNPSFSSKAPKNIPLPGISMKTLFLQNLSICKKSPKDESTKENVKTPQAGRRPGDNLLLLKDRKDTTSSAAGFKSPLKSTKPCKLPLTREPVTTRQSVLSKKTVSILPSKMQTPPSQTIWSQKKQSRRPTILGAKPIISGKSKFLGAENLSNGKCFPNYVRYASLLKGSTVQSNNTNVNHRKQSLTINPGITPSKTDSKDRGVVLESSKRANSAHLPCDKPPGVDDSGSTPKKQKIQDSDMPRAAAITRTWTNDIPAAKTPPEKKQVYTIVLSDSSDDEHSYVLVDKIAPTKHAVAKLNPRKKKTLPKRKLATKMLQGQSHCKANVSLPIKSSDTSKRTSKNINRSNPKVPVKKALQTKNSTIKKNQRAKIQLSDSESEECYTSDSGEPPKLVENPTKRVRGSWKGGCRSCPGCQIDVPRKQQPKQVPVRNKVRPKRKSHSTDSDSSIEIINIIPRKDRHSPKPEPPPAVIMHGLTSSDDSLDDIQDEQVLGHGRTALVFVTEPPGSEVSEEKTLPLAEKTFGNPIRAIPEQELDVDKWEGIGSTARSTTIRSQNTSVQKSGDTDLPQTNPPLYEYVSDGNPLNHSSHNSLEQQQPRHETNESVLRITDAPYSIVSLENSTKLEIPQPDSLEIPCRNVDNSARVLNVDSGVKDESRTQQSLKSNNSHGKTSIHGIGSPSPRDVEDSHNNHRPECNEKCGDVPMGVEYPSCESLDSSIAVENLDSHDYSGSNCSSLSSLESKDIFDQAGIEKEHDHGPDISSLRSKIEVSRPEPEEHHEVFVEANDSQKTNDCSVFANAMGKVDGVANDSRTSLVCRSACKQDSALGNGVVRNAMSPEVSLAIPAPDEIQMLQSKVMPDVQSSVSNDGLDALPDESSVVSHAFPAHGNKCEGPATSDHVVNISNFVPNPSNAPFSEYGPISQEGVTGNEDLGQACEKSEAIFHSNVMQDKVAGQHTLGTLQALLEDSHSTFELPCPSIGSQEAPFESATVLLDSVPEMIPAGQNCEMSSGSDGVLRNTDQPKEPSSDINHFSDNNCNVATNGERRDTDNQSPPEHQSQESISNELSHLLNDFVESVKLDNREVTIRKANLKSSETKDNPAPTNESGSSEESAIVAKELNLLVPLNSRLMIKKLPLSNVGNAAYSQDIYRSEDSVTHDYQVPEDPPSSTPDMTTPSKSLYERKGYPTPIKRLNPSVLSIIKYNDLEIDNDEPSLNDPPETDLVECVSSKGVRFALNPDNLSSIEDFLNIKPPVDDRCEAPSSSSTKEVESNHTADDLIIDNDEPPLNLSPLKRGKHTPPIPENEEDLEDLVIDNDAPPLNESAEAVTEVKPVSNDSDCLIISSDDEVCTSPAVDSQFGKIPEVKISPIPPSRMLPRPKKKLFRIRRSSIVDSVRSSNNHRNHGNLKSRLKLPRVDLRECPRVVHQEVFNLSELEIPSDGIINEVVINDCGIQTKRLPSEKPLPPFQSSKHQLNVPVVNPIGMSSIHNGDDLCTSQEGPCGDIPQIESTDQVMFDLGDLEFSDGDIINEVVIDDSGSDSMSHSSWQPLPRIQGCQETLLQPQVFDLHGQPLKLDQGQVPDRGSNIASVGDTISSSQVSFDLSKTFTDSPWAECLSISDSDTLTASESEGDVIVVSSPRIQPRSTVKKNVAIYENGCETKDSSHIAVSDSDDDLIEVSAPDSFTRVNQTRNFKPSTVCPPLQCADLRSQVSASKSTALPTGTQVRAVPNGNGDFYYVLVVPPNQCSRVS